MQVIYVLKRLDGTETAFGLASGGEQLPAAGDAIAVPPGEDGAGCYWVSHREWSVIEKGVRQVKVIAKQSPHKGDDCCPLEPAPGMT